MNLGDRIQEWLQNLWNLIKQNPQVGYLLDLVDMWIGALHGKPIDATRQLIDTLGTLPLPTSIIFAQMLSALTGKTPATQTKNVYTELQSMMSDPAGYLAKKMAEVSTNPDIQRGANAIATLIDNNVFAVLRDASDHPEKDILTVTAELVAAVTVAKTAIHSVGVSAEILGLGQIKTVDAALEDVMRTLSPERIVETLVAAMVGAALLPPAHRVYNSKFRPARLSVNDLAVLERFGVVDDATLMSEGAQAGWRDVDIGRIKELIRQRVTPGDAQAARDIGMIDDNELLTHLRAWRYSDDDATFEMELAARTRHEEWGSRLFNLALRQFTNYRIDANKLSTIAREIGFSQERIDIEIAIAKTTLAGQSQDLTVAEIESAYKANILSDVEATNQLNAIHIDPSGIPVLLETWKSTIKAGGKQLNAKQLMQAYQDGLIDDGTLRQRLQALGWNPTDARLLVQMAEWQKPQTPRQLSESLIATAFTDGILTNDQAVSKLVDLGFTNDDAATILRLHTILPAQKTKTLTASEIAKAAELGAIGEQNAINRLVQLGYTQDDAALLFYILTNKVPSAKQTKPL